MTRALVTGVTGGLGRALSAELRRAGIDVVGLATRPTAGIVGDSFISADIATLDWDALEVEFDVVFHLAAYVHRPVRDADDARRASDVNADATARIAEMCRKRALPLVFASSVMAALADDSHASPPPNAYATSKREGERAVQRAGASGLRQTILRFPLLYGPFGRGNMERLIRAIYRRRYWPIGPTSVRKSCLYFTDAANALMVAWEKMSVLDRTFIVSAPIAPTLSEIHREAYAAFGRRAPRPALPARVVDLGAQVVDMASGLRGGGGTLRASVRTLTAPAVFDGSAFAAATGFAPRISLAEGMRQTAAWVMDPARQA